MTLSLFQHFLIFLTVFAAAAGLLALGLALRPRPYRKYPEPSHLDERQALRGDLPGPVRRHLVRTVGENPPLIRSAVVWGRGRANLSGVWAPLRFIAWYLPGEGFARRMEFTFFLRPALRAGERLVNGQGQFQIGDREETGPGVDQGERLALWAEMVWLPSVFGHDPRLGWEAVDEHSVRLTFPAPGGEDSLTAHFDPLTGTLTHLAGLRFSQGSGEKEPWRFDLQAWKEVQGMQVPCEVSVAWGEIVSPWMYWSLDGIAYNVNVSGHLKA